MSTAKRIRLNGLRQNTVGHTAAGLWRHPQSQAHRYRELAHWVETAQVLERGCFDSLFIADALGPLEVFTRLDPEREWTPRAIAEFVGLGGGGPVLVGAPEMVADELEGWMEEGDLDGFNIADPVPPVTLRDFVELVVPELQRRGRVWTEYAGSTLRERFTAPGQARLGADHPAGRLRQAVRQ